MPSNSSPVGGGAALLDHHLEQVLIITGPKLPKTGGWSTDDPTGDSTGRLTSLTLCISYLGPRRFSIDYAVVYLSCLDLKILLFVRMLCWKKYHLTLKLRFQRKMFRTNQILLTSSWKGHIQTGSTIYGVQYNLNMYSIGINIIKR